jgi:death-on-curing protein
VEYLTAEQILFIHARLIEETGGAHGVRDLDMLLSALGRAQASFGEQDLYPNMVSKAAALMDSLIRNHPFVDGNKRTGVTAAGLFLYRNGYRLIADSYTLVETTMRVAKSQISVEELAIWLEDNSKPHKLKS